MRNYLSRAKSRKMKLSPTQFIFFSFIVLILIGAVLLDLPIATRSHESVGFLTALFTSTSAVCITGLIAVPTNLTWSPFGQWLILAMIQVGGLGFMSIATLLALFIGRKISLRERLTIQESLSEFSLSGMVRTLKAILLATLIIESIGALILSARLIPLYGISGGIYRGIFHSVSAFCNAGFDIFGTAVDPYSSLTTFYDDPVILLTISALIIVGGLGFIVWKDLFTQKRFSFYRLHTKVVLLTTLFLLISGTLLFLFLEYNNPLTLQGMSWPAKILNAFFQSVSSRSAGFNSFPMEDMSELSKLLTVILMFIGAASGSTGGGVKVTTFSVLLFTVIASLRGNDDVNILRNRIPRHIVLKSLTLVTMGFVLVLLTTAIIMFNQHASFINSVFEATSAVGTAGLTTGLTPQLNVVSRLVLIVMMFIGRVGLLTAALALRNREHNLPYRYPEGKITVG